MALITGCDERLVNLVNNLTNNAEYVTEVNLNIRHDAPVEVTVTRLVRSEEIDPIEAEWKEVTTVFELVEREEHAIDYRYSGEPQ